METQAKDLTYWFDIPSTYQSAISQTGNPWLVLMLPIAMEAGEDISIPFPVDSRLLENVRGFMAVWHDWFPKLRPADVEAPITLAGSSPAGRRGLFFSGGVDSFFTLLRHDKNSTGCGGGPADTLIFMEGFDLPLSAKQELVLARQTMGGIARAFDKSFLPVRSNVRELDTPYSYNWILSHGCALGAVAHLLDGEFAEILISSSYEYGHLLHIGSHPMTDPLMSSRSLQVIHDGASFSRPEKIAHVSTSDRALQNLRVCYAAGRHNNCSRCPKCLFTMVTIDALGLADRAASFDWSAYKMESIAWLLLDDLQVGRARNLIEAARCTYRNELAAALQTAIDRSVRISKTLKVVRNLPYLWRYEYRVRQFLLRGSFRSREQKPIATSR